MYHYNRVKFYFLEEHFVEVSLNKPYRGFKVTEITRSLEKDYFTITSIDDNGKNIRTQVKPTSFEAELHDDDDINKPVYYDV